MKYEICNETDTKIELNFTVCEKKCISELNKKNDMHYALVAFFSFFCFYLVQNDIGNYSWL